MAHRFPASALLLGCLLLGPRVAWSACPGVTTPLRPYATEQLTVGDTATALTPSLYQPAGVTPSQATLTVEGGAIRYQVVGIPTATDGHPLASTTVIICGVDAITAFRAIRQTTDALLTVTYFRPRVP